MKKILSLVLAVGLMLSISAFSVSAADTNSQALLEVTAGELVIIDPPDTGDPQLPGIEGGGRGMNFGTREVSTADETYMAIKTGTPISDQNDPANYKPIGLIVSDARGTDGAKWDVKVKISKFNAAADTLKGFKLTLNFNTTPGVVGVAGAINPPVPTASVELMAEEASKDIFNSNDLGSLGKWGGNWQPELLVRGGKATAESHSATVTWSITETP